MQPCDVQVQNLRISYAMKDKNPVDHVRFFDKSDVSVSYRIPKSRVSHVMPEVFSERILRVFIKDIETTEPSKPKFEALKAATTEWLKIHSCLSPVIKRTASGALSRKPSFLHKSPLRPSSQPTTHTAVAAAAETGSIVEVPEEESAASERQTPHSPHHSVHPPQYRGNGAATHDTPREESQSVDGKQQQLSSLKRKRASSSSGTDADSSGESVPYCQPPLVVSPSALPTTVRQLPHAARRWTALSSTAPHRTRSIPRQPHTGLPLSHHHTAAADCTDGITRTASEIAIAAAQRTQQADSEQHQHCQQHQ